MSNRGEPDEKSQLCGFNKNPEFSVNWFSVNCPSFFLHTFYSKFSTQKFVQEILNLFLCVRGWNFSIEEDWIDIWSKQCPQLKPIQHKAFEILAFHRIIDVANFYIRLLLVTLQFLELPTMTYCKHILKVYSKIFKEKNDWKVSTILHLVKE